MPAELSAREFDVRPSTPADADELNALYRKVSGRVRNVAQWRWEWLDTPRGRAPSWVIVARAGGAIVGHHGLNELELRAGERVLRAARTDNTMVDPDQRTALYYPGFEAQLFKAYRANYDVVITAVAGEVLSAMRRRMGYRVVGNWIDHVVGDSLAYRAGRSLGKAGSSIASALTLSRGPSARGELELTRDVERIERLWRAARHGGELTIERSAAYVSWRLAEHAWHRHELALLVEDGRDVAFVAWREKDAGGGALRVLVQDAFTREGHEASYANLFAALTARFRGAAARVQVRTLDGDTALARAARKLAGEREREPRGDTQLLAWFAGEPVSSWSITNALDAGL